MKEDFLGLFMGNPARARLVRAFIFDPSILFTLPQIAKRSGMTSTRVAREIKVLEKFGIVKKGMATHVITLARGKKTKRAEKSAPIWTVNQQFPYLSSLSAFVHDVSPAPYDAVLGALKRSGKLSAVILSGSFMGDSARPADLIVVVDSLNDARLEQAVKKLESSFGREIRYAAFSTAEFSYRLTVQDRLVRETIDFPHVVLMDRMRLLPSS